MVKKILVPIFNRAHYGRLRPVLKAVQDHPGLELQLMVASAAAHDYFWLNLKHSQPHSWRKSLPAYIRAKLLTWADRVRPGAVFRDDFVAQSVLKDGFEIHSRVPLFLDGGTPETMAKSVGLGMIGLVDELKRLKPDIVFINADRFEMMAVALAASYLNIPIAHNEAGDVSGTIDESIRHSITKLAHLHFTATEASRRRVIQMGENPNYVFPVGSPAIDAIKDLNTRVGKISFSDFAVPNPYLLVLLHPVTTESPEANYLMARNVVEVLRELAMPAIFLGSNIDAMSAKVGQVIRSLRENPNPVRPGQDRGQSRIFVVKHLPPDDFYRVLANAACAVGNSSSFIREGAYFGAPAVLVGSRQEGRERGENVITVGIEPGEIKKGIAYQLGHGRYPKDTRFGDGRTSQKIAEILASARPPTQKTFRDI